MSTCHRIPGREGFETLNDVMPSLGRSSERKLFGSREGDTTSESGVSRQRTRRLGITVSQIDAHNLDIMSKSCYTDLRNTTWSVHVGELREPHGRACRAV